VGNHAIMGNFLCSVFFLQIICRFLFSQFRLTGIPLETGSAGISSFLSLVEPFDVIRVLAVV
jgi:hypothetical protein